MIGKMEREQLESHLMEFADAYGPWAVLLVVTNALKPLFKEAMKGGAQNHEADPQCAQCQSRESRISESLSGMSSQNVHLMGKVDTLSTAAFEAMQYIRDGSESAAVCALEDALRDASEPMETR